MGEKSEPNQSKLQQFRERIFSKSFMKRESEKLFGRWHELILVMIGGFLTLFGAVIAFEMQAREQRHEYSLHLEDKRLADASTFIDGLNNILMKHIYLLQLEASSRLIDTNLFISGEHAKDLESSEEVWVCEVPHAFALTRLYFGNTLATNLKDNIFLKFNNVYNEIQTIRPNDKEAYQTIQNDLNDLEASVSIFLVDVYSRIDSRTLEKPKTN